MTAMNCHAVVELVTDYLENALPPETTEAVAHHLASCADCDRYLDEMCWTLEVLAKLPPEPPPPQVYSQLRATFRTWAAAR